MMIMIDSLDHLHFFSSLLTVLPAVLLKISDQEDEFVIFCIAPIPDKPLSRSIDRNCKLVKKLHCHRRRCCCCYAFPILVSP